MTTRPRLSPSTVDEGDSGRLSPDDVWDTANKMSNQKLKWLLPNRVITGSIFVIEGQKGVGKSSIAVALAASLSSGSAFLGRKKSKEKKGVLWLASEEHFASVVKPRLSASGADLSRIHPLRMRIKGRAGKLTLPSCLDMLTDGIHHFDAGLVVVDPWISCLDPNLCNKEEQQIRSALDPLNQLMMETNCCSLLTRHWTKNRSADRIDRGTGSVAIAATARSVMAIDWPDRSHPRRVLRVTAGNELNNPLSVEYELANADGFPVMVGMREIKKNKDDPDGDLEDSGERDARGDARKLLIALLSDGPQPYSVIEAEARRAGVNERTLRSVKAHYKCSSARNARAVPPFWNWCPPVGGFPK